MRCKTCDYRLWNLVSRRCPECGSPFRPSDYEFTANSVQFRCPHCNQSYYGIGERGHLDPEEFDCVSCGKHIHMDEMVLLPTDGVVEERTQVEQVPWLERKRRGRVRAWFSTVSMALIRPGRLMEILPEEGATGQALLFGVITTCLVALAAGVSSTLFPIIIMLGVVGGGSGVVGILAVVGTAVFGFVLLLVLVAICWGLVIHAILRMTGRTMGGIRRTYQAVLYGSGANVVSAVPYFGTFVGWIWYVISTVFMVRQRQNVSGGRAAFAVLTFPVLTILGVVGLYAWFIIRMVTIMPTPGALPVATTAPGGPPIAAVLKGLRDYAADHNGFGPRHAIELLAGEYIGADELISSGSLSRIADIWVCGRPLVDFIPDETAKARQAAEVAAARTMPAGTVAHRLGDFVFTYHGVRFSKPGPQLWVVVQLPDPEANRSPPSTGMIEIGLADGSTVSIPYNLLPFYLAQQNDLRKQYGLRPLPDLAGITHARPGVAPTGQ